MDHLQSKSSYEINTRPISGSYDSVVFLSYRQISWLAIVGLSLITVFFLGGYFMGKRHLAYWFDNQSTTIINSEYGLCKRNKQSGFYAQLASFGSQQAAILFVEYLQQKKIIAKVVERKNDTVSGRSIVWYQVVTEIFDTQDELDEVLHKLEQEKLSDIRIIIC